MSSLAPTDFPSNAPKSVAKIEGRIEHFRNSQGTAASLAASVLGVVDSATREIVDAQFTQNALCAAGESMTLDILKNGTSVLLSAPLTIDSTVTSLQTDLYPLIDPAKRSLAIGDVLTCTRVYTAGGGATPMGGNVVVIEQSFVNARR